MVKILRGDRIARQGKLVIGCIAVVFNDRNEVLLTRRSDNNRWCLPSGQMESGESVSEACARETFEETGFEIEIQRLIGVYSDPHSLTTYADGNRYHAVGLCFEAEVVGGEFTPNGEVTEIGYFSVPEARTMDLMERHQIFLEDALTRSCAAFVR